MPKKIIYRNVAGIECFSRRLRSGHLTKPTFICPSCPETIQDYMVLFTEQMNLIIKEFFEPFYENPFNIDLKNTYNKLDSFFDTQRTIYANKPEIIIQIDFITNAMRSVRKEGSQYFLKTLQYTSLAREIETTIHGLLMHIYMLNTRIAILSGYTGENEVKGKTAVELHTIAA